MKNLSEKLKKIKILAVDFDGIMTDGYVYTDQNGKETVRCSRKDGLGNDLLRENGIELMVISKETNPVVTARCKKLKIECWQKVHDGEGKLEILKRIIKEKGFGADEAAYMGDDLNDIKVLEYAGLAITVADGHELVKQKCHYITKAKGGQHAVREVCEEILKAKGVPLSF